MAAKRNKALDSWLESSKKVNMDLAENPEAREAAEAQLLESRDNMHIDPTDEDKPDAIDPNDDTGAADNGEPDVKAEGDDNEAAAARAAEEAREAAAAAASGAEPKAEDITKELEKERQKAARFARDREEARRQLALERQRTAELQAQVTQRAPTPAAPGAEAKPKQAEDPEPDAQQFPVEHDQWEIRENRRQTQTALEETRALRDEMNQIKQGNEAQRMESEFVSLMDQEKETFKADHEDFAPRLDYLKGVLRKEMTINGVPSHQIEQRLRQQETQFLVMQTQRAQQMGEPYPGQYALERLSEMSEARGYRVEATETPPAGAAKPKAAPDANAQIADRQKRGNAARTATTMSTSAAQVYDPSETMTAERFLAMTPAQRAVHRKKDPGITARLLGEGDEREINPLLVGR